MLLSSHNGRMPPDRKQWQSNLCCKLRRPGPGCVERDGGGPERQGWDWAIICITVKTCLFNSHSVGFVTHPFQQKTGLTFLFDVLQESTNKSMYACTHTHIHKHIYIITCIDPEKEGAPCLTCCMLPLPCDFKVQKRARLQPVPGGRNLTVMNGNHTTPSNAATPKGTET